MHIHAVEAEYKKTGKRQGGQSCCGVCVGGDVSHLVGFIEALGKVASAQQVFDLACATVSPLGYDKLGLFALTPAAEKAVVTAAGDGRPIVISNYADAFTSTYCRARRHEIDPVLPLAGNAIAPLVWSDLAEHEELSAEQRMLVEERCAAGIHDEVTCPIHASRGRTFALRFARGGPGRCEPAHLALLQVLTIHFSYAFFKYRTATAGRSARTDGLSDAAQQVLPIGCMLSRRERQVMVWTARGKSASSIGTILGLRESTINSYARNAMRKLGTTNRMVAVVAAVRAGLIQP